MNKCKDCAFFKPQNICVLNKQNIDPEGIKCQLFKSLQAIHACEICNNKTINPIVYQSETETKCMCANCAHKSGTCELCAGRFQCEFETNTSPLPKTIIKQIQQGMGIVQTKIKNPDRIKETCMKGCSCWNNDEQYCSKEIGTCGRYKLCFG